MVMHYIGKDGHIFDGLRFSQHPKWPEVQVVLNEVEGCLWAKIELATIRAARKPRKQKAKISPPPETWTAALRLYFPESNKNLCMRFGCLLARFYQHVGNQAIADDVRQFLVPWKDNFETDFQDALAGRTLRRKRIVPIEERERMPGYAYDLSLLQHWEDVKNFENSSAEDKLAEHFDITARIILRGRPGIGATLPTGLVTKVKDRLTELSTLCSFECHLSSRDIHLASRQFRKTESYQQRVRFKQGVRELYGDPRYKDKNEPPP